MFVLGLQGSPRRKGNSVVLLTEVLAAAQRMGARTETVEIDRRDIQPCKEYIVCEKKGYCPIDDEMTRDVYPLIRRADIVIAATPIFFYGMTAQLKAVIDRCQTFWALKYRFRLKDPNSKWRCGFLLSVAATRGKQLFEGVDLTMKYFFDAIDARYVGSLTYPGIESRGDMAAHPTFREDVDKTVRRLLSPFLDRKKILFVCPDNAAASQIAAALAQSRAGDRLDISSSGLNPAESPNPVMIDMMKEKGIDMSFRETIRWEDAVRENPEHIVAIGCEPDLLPATDARVEDWEIPDIPGEPIDQMRRLYDFLEARVDTLIDKL